MTINELAQCVTLLLKRAEWFGIHEVRSETDGYLYIPSPEWRNIYAHPWPRPAVGSFSDDQEELSKLLTASQPATAVDLEWAAHLLLLLSDQMLE